MDAYLTLCRCREDLVMLKEAQNTVNYYEDRKSALVKAIECTAVHTSNYSRGITARLHQILASTLILLEQSHRLVEVIHLNNCPDEEDSSDSEHDVDEYYDDESDDF